MRTIPWNSQPLEAWTRQYAPGKCIELAGHATHYIEEGAGKPVILIHGFFYDSTLWQHNIAVLAAHFKVYAFDLWGFGYSSREPMDYGYALYAAQLLSFMDALGIERASLIGQSMGGGTVIKFTVGHRDRVDKVVLVDPDGMPNPLPLMARVANLPVIGELMYGLGGSFMRRLALSQNFIHDPAHITVAYFDDVMRFQQIKGSSEAMLTILRKRFFDTLLAEITAYGELQVPTLLVWGRQDRSVPVARGEAMHRLMPGSRLAILENVGHCPNDEQAAAFNRLAIDFLLGAAEAA